MFPSPLICSNTRAAISDSLAFTREVLPNFYKVEKWAKDGAKVDRLLYAGNSLARSYFVFKRAIKHRPRIRLTIRRHTRVIDREYREAPRKTSGTKKNPERVWLGDCL